MKHNLLEKKPPGNYYEIPAMQTEGPTSNGVPIPLYSNPLPVYTFDGIDFVEKKPPSLTKQPAVDNMQIETLKPIVEN